MKLVVVANGPVPSRAASAHQVVRMAQAYATAGHDVVLVSPTGGRHDLARWYGFSPAFTHVELSRPDGLPGRGFVYATLAARHARRRGADLVISRSLKAAVAAARAGCATVLEVHPMSHAHHGGDRLLRWLAGSGRLRSVVVVADELGRQLQQRVPEVGPLLATVPNASADPGTTDAAVVGGSVDGGAPERDEPADDEPAGGEAGDRAASQALQVGYVGSFKPGKGVEFLVEIARAAPWARFDLVGGEPRQIASLRSSGVPSNVMLHGHVSPAEADHWRQVCDVLVAPYQRVSVAGTPVAWMSPLKVVEYLAAGRPVVVSDLPEHRGSVDDGVEGFVVAADDVGAWVGALEALRDDGDRRRAFGAAARRRFLAQHTYEQRATRVLSAAGFGR